MHIKSQFKKICASMIEKGSLGAASIKCEGQRPKGADLAYVEGCDPQKVFEEILKK